MNETILQPLGVDLGAEPLTELTEADAERLRVLLALYGVVVAREQVALDDTGFERFLRRFGDPVFTVGETPLRRASRPEPHQQRRPDEPAAQRVPRRHQLRLATAGLHGAARGPRSPSAAGTRCSATSTARPRRCPRTCARASRGAPSRTSSPASIPAGSRNTGPSTLCCAGIPSPARWRCS